MATPTENLVQGQIHIKDQSIDFQGNEILYISIRDSLRHDIECVELGSQTIQLNKNQTFPIAYRCFYDPRKTHMKFDEMKMIPGGITLSATIERDEQILFINETDLPLADQIDIQLIKVD